MNKKERKRKDFVKVAIRVLCFVLALSMVATTFFMLVQYLMAM